MIIANECESKPLLRQAAIAPISSGPLSLQCHPRICRGLTHIKHASPADERQAKPTIAARENQSLVIKGVRPLQFYGPLQFPLNRLLPYSSKGR